MDKTITTDSYIKCIMANRLYMAGERFGTSEITRMFSNKFRRVVSKARISAIVEEMMDRRLLVAKQTSAGRMYSKPGLEIFTKPWRTETNSQIGLDSSGSQEWSLITSEVTI